MLKRYRGSAVRLTTLWDLIKARHCHESDKGNLDKDERKFGLFLTRKDEK